MIPFRCLAFCWRLSIAFLSMIGLPSIGNADQPWGSSAGLTHAEKLGQWELLFDGKTIDKWRNYNSGVAEQDGADPNHVGKGWHVVDGALVRGGDDAGDLITKEKFRWFELSLEYKISSGGNSGVMFHVSEQPGVGPAYSGPEVQICDNAAALREENKSGQSAQLSGWLYQLYRPVPPRRSKTQRPIDATRPAGTWNQVYLRVSPRQCEVCLNGLTYYRFKLGSKDWNGRVANSKFAKFPNFGNSGEGHICLQDYGDEVAFRNIKVRRLDDDGQAPLPIDGKLNIVKKLAFPNLTWDQWEGFDDSGRVRPLRLLELTYAKDDTPYLYAMSQHGAIWRLENKPDVEKTSLFLDLRGKVVDWQGNRCDEQGLLGLAFHPDFKKNGYFYVYYSGLSDDKSVLSRFSVSKDDPNVADPDSEHVVMEIPQPYKNHNGGSIEFGPDGYLYIGLGDGGWRDDPHANGQNLETLLGSILRIDVDHPADGLAYGIPKDNPFVGKLDARGEIYAYGVRNPWRLAFDKKTGRLWSGEVGQNLWEEVIIVQKGGNYGWSEREGTHNFGSEQLLPDDFHPIEPVWEYGHLVGKSITGGRVYRSNRQPELTGKYLYADYVTGKVWALTYDEEKQAAIHNELVIAESVPVFAFGEDPTGEVFLLTDSARGESIYRFETAQ